MFIHRRSPLLPGCPRLGLVQQLRSDVSRYPGSVSARIRCAPHEPAGCNRRSALRALPRARCTGCPSDAAVAVVCSRPQRNHEPRAPEAAPIVSAAVSRQGGLGWF